MEKFLILAEMPGKERYVWYPNILNFERMEKETEKLKQTPMCGYLNTYNLNGIGHIDDYEAWKRALTNRTQTFKREGFVFNDININALEQKGYIVWIKTEKQNEFVETKGYNLFHKDMPHQLSNADLDKLGEIKRKYPDNERVQGYIKALVMRTEGASYNEIYKKTDYKAQPASVKKMVDFYVEGGINAAIEWLERYVEQQKVREERKKRGHIPKERLYVLNDKVILVTDLMCPDEVEPTRELLAQEKGVSASQIYVIEW